MLHQQVLSETQVDIYISTTPLKKLYSSRDFFMIYMHIFKIRIKSALYKISSLTDFC